jgi:uncharacterized protein (TIGR00255 family)
MLRSMTGFGAAQGQVDGVEYAVEVRAVNNRYLKAVAKLPESLASAEGEVDKLIRSRVGRGTVTLTVRMRVPDEMSAYRVNAAALQRYIEQLRPLEVDANPTLRIDLGAMLQLPGVCEPAPLEDLARRTQDGLMDIVAQALDALVKMRQVEGDALKADLLSNCKVIEKNLSLAAERAPQVVAEYHRRLAARVQELTGQGNLKIDEDILAREVAIFAERCDIAEEITRLRGHVAQFREAVKMKEPSGRKLDFIAQEMLREANTIGSKANDAEIARAVVDLKTAVDRIKEQVQNVE